MNGKAKYYRDRHGNTQVNILFSNERNGVLICATMCMNFENIIY